MRDIKALVKQMTLEEKVGMCSGLDFWRLKSVERLGIPRVMVSDGPHGLRKQRDGVTDVNDSIKAVCFPAGCATACSFDRELLYNLGILLGEECQAENVSILLGPAANIKRSPICGRNFEYFSEDPYLSSEMACNYIQGVQSQGVGTSLKHFAANNQESYRMTASAQIDERTLREIYLASFEQAIKVGKPWTMMCSYNRINEVFASENKKLLTDILRTEWGFEGYVMSDWGAVNNRVDGLRAGLDLEMPGSNGANDSLIIEAIQSGHLDESILDASVERIVTKIFEFVDNRHEATFDREIHHEAARKIATQSAVLLKNEGVLPIKSDANIAFIGKFAKIPRFQGGGSSHINVCKVSSALEAVSDVTSVSYAQGYELDVDKINEVLVQEAIQVAKKSDVAVIFAGLPDSFESEGYDRKHMRLPNCQNALIEEVVKVQPNTVVVLHNGSAVEMPWVHDVKGILEMYLAGQAVGLATVDLLFGRVNPSGKLAETFPVKLSDNPSYLNNQVVDNLIYYREGPFVGYRYYDKKEMNVLFPFGHGLSYTKFEYHDLALSRTQMLDDDEVVVSLKVTNTGTVAGKEIVQLYVSDLTKAIIRPLKELKNFVKIELQAGETKEVSMTLNKRSFATYNEQISDWYVESGEYEILIGKSSRDIVLKEKINIKSTVKLPFRVTANTTLSDLLKQPKLKSVIESLPYIVGEFNQELPIRALRSFKGIDNAQMDDLIQTLNDFLF
ncbi:glycoside hydrolase family 3 C-terminal domain-containing protein [Turicibacter sanguinis]|uniref:glycoside hydrolase family 3 C-terminal domain-containing protein n=1 Tax=Turicibacter sanguinis TaxID=154288 RepID=UPI0021D4F4B0|nr:glycoside hydrolase family 3 C-terminal domain-containing protein [Turicibacter sanguinis]MCU7202975.1 glycoside hydrolase family 3 C-terminal domain-containing protein [Turicibacter sanguinis]